MPSTSTDSIFQVEQIARLPRHLRQHIVEQRYDRYTAVDHAVWRYIMRQALDFHSRHAHASYIEGLRQTGIGLERIPRVEEMNEILARIGWGAAPVDGFIPPAAFMEFQAHRVLVIAADIRQLDHIQYTPAPDIVHEAAGHAPIIADPEYAEYLRRFGEVGAKAMSSHQDFELYEAIRRLSILKEAPGTPPEEIAAAERKVNERQTALGEPSEMARLSRLHWWTVEYGLIGSLDDPKLYGAGLLSSIGEAAHCLSPAVVKLPYSIAAADVAFDITTMQPQLFVTPSFAHLTEVLETYADSMAFRRGGDEGLEKAVSSGNVATVVYSSGLQVSGIIGSWERDEHGTPAYIRTTGPTALAVADRELLGHDKTYHRDGFGSPIGRLRGASRPTELLDGGELAALGLREGSDARLELTSGVTLAGRLERITRANGKIVLLTFSGCRVARGDELLFDPVWGTYDMAVGERIGSVFQGAADQDAYDQVALVPETQTSEVAPDETARRLHRLYATVRDVREGRSPVESLTAAWRERAASFPADWLLALEILEVLTVTGALPDLRDQVRAALTELEQDPTTASLVANGLRLLPM